MSARVGGNHESVTPHLTLVKKTPRPFLNSFGFAHHTCSNYNRAYFKLEEHVPKERVSERVPLLIRSSNALKCLDCMT